ncbi:ABC transporter ATP-binding protein [Sphingobium sp. B2D3C]|uniref:ABC transporter ATP-binding protein n=1 Tax=Sphingobium sp. B2D3C TaxID=2940581 RepID=UPI0022244DC1|nr:ABC transporter ATP-binding protein [Sphingobium sp. B2D3C]MCW2397913.1 ABC-type multidrug transport system fused ATPase/permease subunit [Sphingobium sp. B2D3C]
MSHASSFGRLSGGALVRTITLHGFVTAAHLAEAVLVAEAIGATVSGDSQRGLMLVMGLLVLAIARAAAGMSAEIAASKGATLIAARLRSSLVAKLVAIGPSQSGVDFAGTVTRGVDAMASYFRTYRVAQASAWIGSAMSIIAIGCYAPASAAILLLFAGASPLVDQVWLKLRRQQNAGVFAAMGRFSSFLLESVQGMATLKASDAQARRRSEAVYRAAALRRETMRSLNVGLGREGLTAFLSYSGIGIAVWVAAQDAMHTPADTTPLLVVLLAAREVFRPLERLQKALHAAWSADDAAKGIGTVLDMPLPIRDPSEPITLPSGSTIEFDHVSFAYGSRTDKALDDVSFVITEGRTLAIVGRSGAGKSTIASLIQRFEDPLAGAVRIGGVDISQVAVEDLRSKIAVVSQATYLFPGTIADNLRLGNEAAPVDRLREVARAAGIDDFIAQLPKGYDTLVGERGAGLSGGQRQRISIARALLKDARIVILDEPTSAIDRETERVIQHALQQQLAGRTTLIIAHRLATIAHADEILVLDGGRLVERGNHAQLLEMSGTYATLAKLQGIEA